MVQNEKKITHSLRVSIYTLGENHFLVHLLASYLNTEGGRQDEKKEKDRS